MPLLEAIAKIFLLTLFFANAFKTAKTIATSVVRRVITIWEAIQERSYDWKTNTQNEAKRLGATAIAKLEER